MRPARIVSFAVAALGFLPVAVPPASAAGGAALLFTGTAHIYCFGCGASPGVAALSATGVVGTSVVSGGATASFTAIDNPGVLCMVTGTASGTVVGVVNLTFNWTRLGAFAVFTTAGDVDGAGYATFIVTNPAPPSVPCGGPVDAEFFGVLAGTSSGAPGCTAGPVCVQLTPGAVYQQVDVYEPTSGAGPTHHLLGRVNVYSFPLPGGGTTTLPCVDLVADATTITPCETAGGTYVSRLATLVDRDVDESSPGQGPLLASVRICTATLTATVDGIGVNNVPAYTVC